MSNLNKVLLMGRLTRDPELRYTPQGTPVLEIGVAVNREYSTGTERRKETTFVDVTLWKRQAEVVCQYMRKGSAIFIEGRLSMDSWQTSDGQKRSRLRVVAENFQFVGPRQEGGGHGGGSEGSGGRYSADASGPQGYQRASNPPAQPSQDAAANVPEPDDDLGAYGIDESEVPF